MLHLDLPVSYDLTICRKEKEDAVHTAVDDQVDDDDLEESDLVELDTAPPMNKAAGYWIRRQGDDRDGLVDKINMKTGMMIVMYESADADVVDEEEVSYHEVGLKWLDDADEADN